MTDTTTVQPAPEPALQPGRQPAPAEPAFGTLPGLAPHAGLGPAETTATDAPYFALPGRWNPLALAAFAAAFIAPVVAIVFGHLALRDLRWNGERGRKLAFWGVVLGYVFSALLVIGGVVAIVASAHHGFGGGRLGTGIGGFGGQGGFGGGTGGFGSGGGAGNGFGGGFGGQGYGSGQGGTTN